MRSESPLRYPGGKWRFASFFYDFIGANFATPPAYIEPYAGGASLALDLLLNEVVSRIWLNDLDPAIYACWNAMLTENERFCLAIKKTPITLAQRDKQKKIYALGLHSDQFDLGFATFYLNRTNHSGILNGGVIGGRAQTGTYKIDARFNKEELIRRVRNVANHRDRIKLTGIDANQLVRTLRPNANCLVYLDPPYVRAGSALYMNAYETEDHEDVSRTVGALRRTWIVSYDDTKLVRRLYRHWRVRRVQLQHTARAAKSGTEVLFFSSGSVIPKLSNRTVHV